MTHSASISVTLYFIAVGNESNSNPEKIPNDVVFKTEACPVSGFSFQGFPHPWWQHVQCRITCGEKSLLIYPL